MRTVPLMQRVVESFNFACSSSIAVTRSRCSIFETRYWSQQLGESSDAFEK